MYKIYRADCFNIFPKIADKSIDLIFCDLPYGYKGISWDKDFDIDVVFKEYLRIVKEKSAIVLTASQPFTSKLIMSFKKYFRCEWIWEKKQGSNFMTVKYHPFKKHESVLIFCKKSPSYYPIKEKRKGAIPKKSMHPKGNFFGKSIQNTERIVHKKGSVYDELVYPSSVQYFDNSLKHNRGSHPTQKPIELCEYFIKTYSKEKAFVLDNCMGSGSIGVACINTNRNFIGIEKEKKYYDIAKKRIKEAKANLKV